MLRRRIGINHLRVGTPLPFDAYDLEGKLLLARGFLIESREQLERLVERGLFYDSLSRDEAVPAPVIGDTAAAAPASPGRLVSVFEEIADLRRRLDEALRAPATAEFSARIEAIARGLSELCSIDSDAALATILLARKERYSIRQALNVALLAELLMRQLEQPEPVRLQTACATLTMNIAAMELQDALYFQKTPPDDAQRHLLWRHPGEGEAQLRALGVASEDWLRAVREHHEAIDGSGYPAKLAGEAIGLPARVITLADRYCAMVSERATRPGTLPNLALREIYARQGNAIDTRLAGLLVKEISVYPPGTLVRLATGETGVAVKRTLNASHPVVKVILDARGKPPADFHKRLTSKSAYAVTGVLPLQELGEHCDCDRLWPATRVAQET